MKKFTYKNLKLFLYLCILLFIINCTFNNEDRSNIDIIEISQEINKLQKDNTFIDSVLKDGAEKARDKAYKTLDKVYRKIGLVKKK